MLLNVFWFSSQRVSLDCIMYLFGLCSGLRQIYLIEMKDGWEILYQRKQIANFQEIFPHKLLAAVSGTLSLTIHLTLSLKAPKNIHKLLKLPASQTTTATSV